MSVTIQSIGLPQKSSSSSIMVQHGGLAAGGGGGTYPGITIELPTTDWVGLYSVNITDQDDNEIFIALTAKDEGFLTYASISAGEFATDSTYGATTTRDLLNNGLPDITDSSASTGVPEWSTGASSGMKVFVKFSADDDLKYIDMPLNTGAYSIDPADVVFKEEGGATVITPTTSPADETDVHQTTSNGNVKWYRWIF